MVKIYIQNKPLFLVDEINGEVEKYLLQPETAFTNELNTPNISNLLQQMERDSVHRGIFQHSDAVNLLQAFRDHLTLIKAAGGLVYNQNNDILLIFRKSRWDLPKGKLDEGENLEACALREIEEETGVANTKIICPLIVTYHTYHEKGTHILKESHWFLIESDGASTLKPQIEEDIERCEWVPADSLPAYVGNMHASIIDVVNKGLRRMIDGA